MLFIRCLELGDVLGLCGSVLGDVLGTVWFCTGRCVRSVWFCTGRCVRSVWFCTGSCCYVCFVFDGGIDFFLVSFSVNFQVLLSFPRAVQ